MRKYLCSLIFPTILLYALTGCSTSSSLTTEKESEMIQQIITIQDLETCITAIGQKPEILGITNIGEHEYSTDLQGTVLGLPVYGYVFYYNSSSEDRTIQNINLYQDELTLTSFYPLLTDLFGGPVEYGQEPFVEVNGGARTWFRFDAGNTIIELSQGSKEPYCMMELRENKTPGYTGKLILSTEEIKIDPNICLLPLIVSLHPVQYENGLLRVEVNNQSGEDLTFSGNIELYIKTSDSYRQLYPIEFAPVDQIDAFDVSDLEKKEISFDLRRFGKVQPGDYRIILDGLEASFTLNKANT